MIFETHTHFDDKAFDEDRDEAIRDAINAGVGRIVNVGASMDSSRTSVELAAKYPEIYAAVGVHPEDCANLTEHDMDILKRYASKTSGYSSKTSGYSSETSGCASEANGCVCNTKGDGPTNKVVAIGEIGLDYYWDEPERDIQKKWFIRQLQLAKEVNLPIIVHSRDAAKDTIDIIRSEHNCATGGVIHCFSYGIEMAREYLDMGYYIGVGGVVTFKNGKKLKEVVEYTPIDRIVVETDSPYLAPVPNRGKRNSSANLPYIIEEIAKIKGLSAQEVERITFENAIKLYRM